MHTEHLQSVRFALVGIAWLIAVGLASAIVLAISALGLVDPDSAAGIRIQIAAVAAGFFGGGLFVGLRVGEAPILHGVAIGLTSLVAWFALNAVSTVIAPGRGWESLTAQLTITVLLLQMVAAVLGARAGYRWLLKRG